jgi:hypothetical protein
LIPHEPVPATGVSAAPNRRSSDFADISEGFFPMTISKHRTSLLALAFSIALAGCGGSEKGVGIATSEDAAATAKAAAETPTEDIAKKNVRRPKIQAEGSAGSMKLEN